MKRLILCFGIFALFFGNTATVLRAQGVTTSAFSGAITDGTDYLKQLDDALAGKITMDAIKLRGLPGARVSVLHVPSGTQYNTVARADGNFNLRGLRVGGPYTITVTMLGFKKEELKDITLGLGENRRVDIAMNNQDVTLTGVQVTANREKAASRTGAGSEISTAQLERTPNISRSFQEMTRTNPYVVGSNVGAGDNVGGINIAGQNNRYNNIQVDGAVINDLFGLSSTGAPGGQAAAQPISLDAIEQMQVSVAPFDVRQSGFTGGLVNSVTRSGTNTMNGSAYFLYRNQSLSGLSPSDNAAQRTPLSTFSDFTVGARLGGAIIPDKLFFFGNVETRRVAQPLELAINRPEAALNFPVPRETIDRIANIAKTKYNYDPGNVDTFTAQIADIKGFLRLDWNISDEHRLTLRHNIVSASQDRGVDRTPLALSFSGLKYVFSSVQNNTVLQLNSSFGSDAANELRVSSMIINDRRGDFAGGVFPFVTIFAGPKGEAVTMGVEPFSQANLLNQSVIEITDDFTMFLGSHSLTIGTHNEIYSSANVFFPWYFGNYLFGSVDDFDKGTPFGYINRFSTDESKYGKTPTANFSSIQLGLYAQDEWDVSKLLRITMGVRGDMFILPTQPYQNPAALAAFGKSTNIVPNAAVLFAPRVGFDLDLSDGNRQTKLRGGTGIFNGRSPIVWLSNQYSNTGVDISSNFIFDGSVTRARYPMQFMNPNNPPAQQTGLTPGNYFATVNFIDPNFRLPQTWRSSLAFEQQLGLGFSGSLEGVYSKLLNQPLYQNLRLGSATNNRIDGRPIFKRDGGTGMVANSFGDAFYLTNTQEGYQFNIVAQIQKPIGYTGVKAGESENAVWKNFGMNLAYTYGESWDVNSNPGFIADENFFVPSRDPNNLPLTRSLFDIPHRIVAFVSYRFEYGPSESPFATTISLRYEGRSGRTFSYVYNGDPNNAAGLFGEAVNQALFFVPRDRSQVSMTDAGWTALNTFITNDPVLTQYRGNFVDRNAGREPWVNEMDLTVVQDIPTGVGRVQITANLFNVLNLLNPAWGHIQFVTRPSQGDFSGQSRVGLAKFNGFETDGRMKLDFQAPQGNTVFVKDNLLSRWQMQLGLRFTF
jgi:hypothetical protein